MRTAALHDGMAGDRLAAVAAAMCEGSRQAPSSLPELCGLHLDCGGLHFVLPERNLMRGRRSGRDEAADECSHLIINLMLAAAGTNLAGRQSLPQQCRMHGLQIG